MFAGVNYWYEWLFSVARGRSIPNQIERYTLNIIGEKGKVLARQWKRQESREKGKQEREGH